MSEPDGEIAVISDLLTILSKYDAKTIGAARHRGGISDNLRAALDALAREARTSALPGFAMPQDLGKRERRFDVPPDASPAEYADRLTDYLMTVLPSKQAILSLAGQLKLALDVTSRDNRARVATKFVTRLSKSKRLRERLAEIMSSTTQTSGYFDVILDER
jgi:hypothetical protein